MIRSSIAVLVGVVIGAIAIVFLEFLGAAAAGKGTANLLAVFGAALIASFAGGGAAALISRGWAPTIWVVALTLMLFVAPNFPAADRPVLTAIGSFLALGAGAYIAAIATRAKLGKPPAREEHRIGNRPGANRS